MSLPNRHTALSILGLSGASIIASEDLAKAVESPTHIFRFGLDHKSTAAALRKLAADLEAGGSYLQEMSLMSKATPDDYLLHTLTVSFAVNEAK